MMNNELYVSNGMYNSTTPKDPTAKHFITTFKEYSLVNSGNRNKVEQARTIIPIPIIMLAAETERFFSAISQPVQYGKKIPHVKKKV